MRLQVVFLQMQQSYIAFSHSHHRTCIDMYDNHLGICEEDIYAIFNMRNILLIENFNIIYFLCTRHDIRSPECKIMLNVIHNFLYATNDTHIYIYFLCTRQEFGSPECEKMLNVLHISIM